MTAQRTNLVPDAPEARDPKPLRPRDAATLLVLDRSGPQLKVLMGKRHEKHRFMPGKFVFPGGAVDRADQHVRPADDFAPDLQAKLTDRMRGRVSPAKARALGLAAIRELFEETGLLIGKTCADLPRSNDSSWRRFLAHGVAPSLDGFMFIARAVTPPRRPRRFDARFFAVDAAHVARQGDFSEDEANELLEVNWLTLDEARQLDLPNITRIVLDHLDERLAAPDPLSASHAVPYYFMRGRTFVREQL